jgi:pimeloyl-ACP methyl ester carboxylesterase
MEMLVLIGYVVLVLVLLIAAFFWVLSGMLLWPSPYPDHKNNETLNSTPWDNAENEEYVRGLWEIPDEDRSKRDVIRGFGDPKTDLGIEFVPIEIPILFARAPNNKVLRGWFIEAPDKSKKLCMVCCHGAGRDRRAWLRHIPSILKSGCAVLLFDLQEHGVSDGQQRGICWATYSPGDCCAALHYARNKLGFEKTIAMGTSMGGVSVILAAALGPGAISSTSAAQTPPRYDCPVSSCYADGVIAENPFQSRRVLIAEVVRDAASKIPVLSLAAETIGRVAGFVVMWRLGASKNVEPIDVISSIAPRPLLIMHGKQDAVVGWHHSTALHKEAAKPADARATLWLQDDCIHTGLLNADKAQFESQLLRVVQMVHEGQ